MTTILALLSFVLAADSGVDAAAVIDGGIDGGAPAETKPPAPPTRSVAIAGVSTNEPVVALTFDACATRKQANGFDRQIFDILSRDKIPATLFLSGRWVEKHPSAARLIAAADFIELGNHTYTHPRLSLMRPERIHVQIAHTNAIIEKKLGRPALSVRPPAGAWNATVLKTATEEHMPLVLWTVVSGDAGGHVPAARMKETVLAKAKPGAIIIFHINKRAPFTKFALPGIIAGLREKGFHFVTVSQLLALPDATIIPAKPSRFGYGPRKKTHLPEEQPAGDEHADPPT